MISCLVVGLFALAMSAQADMRTVSVTITNGQAIKYSDPISIAGVLDKVEITGNSGTNTITLASYSGTTAIDTFVSLSSLTTATKLVRPAFLPTANTGVALAAVTGDTTNSAATTQLNVLYQQAVIEGGEVKMAVTSGNAAHATTNTITARIYFTPFAR